MIDGTTNKTLKRHRLRKRQSSASTAEPAANAYHREGCMKVSRRAAIKGALAVGASTQVIKIPAAVAQPAPIQVGFLTVKTGPLASGGIQMEQGITAFFKEQNYTLGRPQGGSAYRRHRRQSGADADQDAGIGRALEGQCPDRTAGRVRGARDRRLHPLDADADPHGRRRRRHDTAQGQSLAGAAELNFSAAEPSRSAITLPRT